MTYLLCYKQAAFSKVYIYILSNIDGAIDRF